MRRRRRKYPYLDEAIKDAFTLRELALRMQMHESTLRMKLRGERPLSRREFLMLCAAADTNPRLLELFPIRGKGKGPTEYSGGKGKGPLENSRGKGEEVA